MDGGIFGLFFGTKPFYAIVIDRDTQASLTGLKLGRGFPETVVVLRRKIYRVTTIGARTSCLVCHAFRSYHKRHGHVQVITARQITPGVLVEFYRLKPAAAMFLLGGLIIFSLGFVGRVWKAHLSLPLPLLGLSDNGIPLGREN